ncbi:MAG TPA: VanW family protein [Polyangiaceae bacterium]
MGIRCLSVGAKINLGSHSATFDRALQRERDKRKLQAMRRLALFSVALIGTVVLLCSLVLVSVPRREGAPAEPLSGTTFGGYRPDPKLQFEVWLDQQRGRFNEHIVTLATAQGNFELSAGALGIELDTQAMHNVVARQRSSGGFLEKLVRRWAAARGVLDYAWLTRFDRDVARATLLQLAPLVNRAAVDAELDIVRRRQVRACAGASVDVEATLDYVAIHRSTDLDFVPVQMVSIEPNVSDGDLLALDITHTLSRFETDFRTRAGARAVNIRVAAKALNGQVIAPGATFSFNQTVGRRVESRGFLEAPVIVDDEVEPGVGGGVCQVATTLHAAAVFGGLDVLERRSHSRPSGYAPLGLDATVIDGEVDLKLRNPYRTPIAISVTFPERYRLRIELLGMSSPGKFEHAIAVRKRTEFYRRVVTRPELATGTFVRKQKGGWGYEVRSTVTARLSNGTTRKRIYSSRYWPVPEVFWMGPETPISDLPPLPDGAVAVQLDGATVAGQLPQAVEQRAGRDTNTLDSWEQ